MDHATQISMRLKQYAATLTAANSRHIDRHIDDYALEQWLGFWDEDDSVFGNVRNLEHWLKEAQRHPISAGGTRP